MNVWYGAAGYNPAIARPMIWLIDIVRNKAIDKLRSGKLERSSTEAPASSSTQTRVSA